MKKILATLFVLLMLSTTAQAHDSLSIPGGWYGEARVDRQYAVLVKDSHIQTHAGNIPLPDGINVLFVRVPPQGQFKIAGQDHSGKGNVEWRGSLPWSLVGDSFGVNPLIYDWNGQLHQANITHGSQGFRYVIPPNHIVTGDQTIADPARKLWEWTVLGDVTVGQGEHGCISIRGNDRRMIEPGHCTFLRATRIGDEMALTFVKLLEGRTVIRWINVNELTSFPLETVTESKVEICGDKIDNDGDGLADEPPCPPIVVEPELQTCPATNGIVNGKVMDPEAYVLTIVCKEPVRDFAAVIRRLENEFYKFGFGLQAGLGGNMRGRVYLPTAICPNAAPRNESERVLGVKQDEACWEVQGRIADIVQNDSSGPVRWTWAERGALPYQPLGKVVTLPDPTVTQLKQRIAELEGLINGLTQEITALQGNVAQLQSTITHLNQDLLDVTNERDEVKRQLEELQNRPEPRCEVQRSGPGWVRGLFRLRESCVVVR